MSLNDNAARDCVPSKLEQQKTCQPLFLWQVAE
jgi:hypothetical protein